MTNQTAAKLFNGKVIRFHVNPGNRHNIEHMFSIKGSQELMGLVRVHNIIYTYSSIQPGITVDVLLKYKEAVATIPFGWINLNSLELCEEADEICFKLEIEDEIKHL
jgi:hypothetical protein